MNAKFENYNINYYLPTKLRDVFPGVLPPISIDDASAVVLLTWVIKNVMPANIAVLLTVATKIS
jgi:hypothetical protein